MAEELLESEAIEEPVLDDDPEGELPTRLPQVARRSGEISLWRDEVRTAALAAGAGIVAGAATVAAVRATRGSSRRRSARRIGLRRDAPQRVVASRSFLIDVHLLGSK